MAAGDILSGIKEICNDVLTNFSKLIKSRSAAAICVAGGFGIILILLVILVIVRHLPAKAPQRKMSVDEAFPARSLSPEDFFMPPEPDFVPEVLLEREPRDGWSEEDARQFWTDPMEGNADMWRKAIESGVDRILERVP